MVTGPMRADAQRREERRRLRAVCAALLLCALLPVLAGCTHSRAYRRAVAREDPATRIHTYLTFLAERDEFSGYVLIDRSSQALFSGGYGWANVEKGVAFTERSQFRVASITKQFTGAAVLLCRDAGLLSLDDSAAAYLPGTYLPGTELDSAVTLRHLLTHTSGLGSDKEPGEEFAYSNRGYNLLARVVEEVTSLFFREFIREELCVPLGMIDTEIDRGDMPGYVVGYATTDPPVRARGPDYSGGYGAGGLVSTPRDLQKWMRHLADSPADAPLSFTSLTERTVPALPQVRYGYGLSIREIEVAGRSLSMYWHAGSCHGYGAEVCYIPDLDATLIVLSNYGNVDLYRVTTSLCQLLVSDLAAEPTAR